VQVCEEGKPLTSNQAALLRHFNVKMATFRMKLKARVVGRNDDGAQFQVLDEDESDEEPVGGMWAEGGFNDGLPASMMLPTAALAAAQS
jgi:hypothetical protein